MNDSISSAMDDGRPDRADTQRVTEAAADDGLVDGDRGWGRAATTITLPGPLIEAATSPCGACVDLRRADEFEPSPPASLAFRVRQLASLAYGPPRA
jgi:hypothetical protein